MRLGKNNYLMMQSFSPQTLEAWNTVAAWQNLDIKWYRCPYFLYNESRGQNSDSNEFMCKRFPATPVVPSVLS